MKEKLCFFSHNWGDEKDDYKKMIKEKIIKLSDSEIKVVYDKDDFLVSDNLIDKENIILQATTVVLFLSPAYKRAVDSKSIDKGSYREYEKIIKRLSYDKGFLIPVLVAGNIDTAVPLELRNIIYQDATKNNVVFDRHLNSFSSSDEESINKFVRAIIDTTNLLYNIDSEKFSDSVEMVNELIHNNHSKNTLPSNCMILTDAYSQIINQESFVFSGRKGSGKTTLIELIEKYDYEKFTNRYKHLYPISFDKMNVEYLYDNYVNTCQKNPNLFRTSDFVNTFWELFFIFSSIIIICKEYENNRIVDSIQIFEVVQIYEKIKSILKVDSFQNISTESVFAFTNNAMKKRYDVLCAQNKDSLNLPIILVANLNSNSIARNTIGSKVFELFERVVNRCQKKIMIFIDGFNSYSEIFKTISKSLPAHEYKEKIRRDMFETDLYKGLISVVTEIKDSGKIEALKNVHFCIVLPEDRIEQIRISDRDFIKKKISTLRWDAILLINMVNKRLLAINDFESNTKSPFILFDDYMKNFYPEIPASYKFMIKGRETRIELFTYLLSLSFWRPRDILIHLSVLIAAIRDESFEMSDRTLRALLNSSSERIIKDEFYKEYENTIYNLEDIIRSFENKSIILTPNECYKIINNIPFLITTEKRIKDFESKMRFLYEIGFIGVILPENIKEHCEYQTEYCFFYNEGIKPFELINFDSDLRNFKFVINHLFYNTLNLNYNSDTFIEGFSEDYFISNHQLRNLITTY